MMSNFYSVKDIFYSLQGEGFHAGTPSVFVRFAGCNLWNGDLEKRDHWFQKTHAPCARFCDTDFSKGKPMASEDILDEVSRLGGECRRVVLTGGEPTLQVDKNLFEALQSKGYYISLETNGTINLLEGVHPHWITLSPKVEPIVIPYIDEIKVVFPAVDPLHFDRYLLKLHAESKLTYSNLMGKRFIQPEDGPNAAENLKKCVDFVLANPAWRLSLQTHKMVGLP